MDKETLFEKFEEQNEQITMDNAERLEKYFSGEKVDYLPYSTGSDAVIANYFGYTTTELMESNEVKEIVEEENKKLRISGSSVGMLSKNIGFELGSDLVIPENGIPMCTNQVLENYEDLEKIMEHDLKNSNLYKRAINSGLDVLEKNPHEQMSVVVNGPITLASSIRPISKLLRDLVKDKKNYHKLLNYCTDILIDFIKIYYDKIGKGNLTILDPVSTNDLLSRDQFMEFSYPYLEKLIDETISISDQQVNLHICGRTKNLWKDFANLNIRAFSVDNIEDIEELKYELGDKMIIEGNVPPVDVIRFGTIDDVIESVKNTIIKAADSPKGYILKAGCGLTIGTPRENLWAFVYAARKYGKGAKIGEYPDGIKNFL